MGFGYFWVFPDGEPPTGSPPSFNCDQSLPGLLAGTSFGLLCPGAWAGFPEGNCPGGKLAFDGAMRSSSSSTCNSMVSFTYLLLLCVGLLFLCRQSSTRRTAVGAGPEQVSEAIRDGARKRLPGTTWRKNSNPWEPLALLRATRRLAPWLENFNPVFTLS